MITVITLADIANMLSLPTPSVGADRAVCELLTDSRSLTSAEGALFFAITTTAADGHRHIRQLIERGVRAFVVTDIPEDCREVAADNSGITFFRVANVVEALQRIAAHIRSLKPNLPVVGITGSRGKTVVKEWINRLLSPDRRIVRSPRSFNSQIGVPLSVWQLINPCELAIIEAGISQPGEMARLKEVIRPTIGIITGLGPAHSEGFESLADKVAEKVQLLSGCHTIIYPADEPHIAAAVEGLGYSGKAVAWSRTATSEAPVKVVVTIIETNATRIDLDWAESGHVSFSVPFTDSGSVDSAITAFIAATVLGKPAADVARRMAQLTPVETRLDVIDGESNSLLVVDTFTADLSSLMPALDFMQRRATPERRTTLIVSDLVHDTTTPPARLYSLMAAMAHARGVTRIVGVGPEISAHANLLGPDATVYASTEALMADIQLDHELVLIKGAPEFRLNRLVRQLEARQHTTVLEVNLDAMVHNYNYYRSLLRPTTGIVAMVKASAYGAGATETARTLQSQGAAYLAVAVADEAIELRHAGITMPLMVLNPKVDNYSMLFAHRLEPEIYSFDILDEIIREGERLGVTNFPVHIKLDTGMHRLGFLEGDMPRLAARLAAQTVVAPRSVFCHLAAADDPAEDAYTHRQFAIFHRCYDILKAAFPDRQILRHVLNSAGIARFPEEQMDMVRLGVSLYGIDPLPGHPQATLHPVSSLRTLIISIKEWPAGQTIGYNRRGVLTRPSRIATIPIGYADGLNRRLGNGRGEVCICGHRCPTVGNICMDICMIDVTGVDCQVGDEVEIFGSTISVDEIARRLDTIPYEVLTAVSPRVKRVYYRE